MTLSSVSPTNSAFVVCTQISPAPWRGVSARSSSACRVSVGLAFSRDVYFSTHPSIHLFVLTIPSKPSTQSASEFRPRGFFIIFSGVFSAYILATMIRNMPIDQLEAVRLFLVCACV